MKTYDVQFNDGNDSNSKGFNMTYDYCLDYIRANNGSNESYFEDYKGGMVSIVCNESYFEDYKGGMVSIVCNETGETVYEGEVR